MHTDGLQAAAGSANVGPSSRLAPCADERGSSSARSSKRSPASRRSGRRRRPRRARARARAPRAGGGVGDVERTALSDGEKPLGIARARDERLARRDEQRAGLKQVAGAGGGAVACAIRTRHREANARAQLGTTAPRTEVPRGSRACQLTERDAAGPHEKPRRAPPRRRARPHRARAAAGAAASREQLGRTIGMPARRRSWPGRRRADTEAREATLRGSSGGARGHGGAFGSRRNT